ncbi:MAG: PEP/pyruvate-binding domain-containing protein [Desulfovibrio aminophilus]|uniref:PEP/pyruvate-binding domain-containing protein n=1 Tax=Desulfovibrio aminophilus TaxID=81425 RepID=UPI0039EBB615
MLRRLFKRKKRDPQLAAGLFKAKYSQFKALLESNSELLQLLTDLEQKLRGDTVFGMAYVRSQASRIVFHAVRMANNFDKLSSGRLPALREVVRRLSGEIASLAEIKRHETAAAYILPYPAISRDLVDSVGGKNANLGEIAGRAGLPIPDGFAITTAGYEAFVRHGGFLDEVKRLELEVDPADPETMVTASEGIQRLFLTADAPEDLSEAILSAYADLCVRRGAGPEGLPISMRSSAIGEDSELSFAGQYLSVLNVRPDRILDNYRRILASLFTPRAIAYRLHKGIPDEDIAMSVACLEMVEAKASGVMYSRHPFDLLDENVLINAVWGLGPYAVDGVVTPDVYRFTREDEPRPLETRVAVKDRRLVARPGGVLEDERVPEAEASRPCLDEEQARLLASYAVRLERHYHCPQDIEWALNTEGRLVLLQARPLRAEAGSGPRPTTGPVPGREILLEGGDAACPGVGAGPVRHVWPDSDLTTFPEGAVLVAEHSSPKYALILPRIQAVVTNAGSVTGHMASLAREYGVPSLLNTRTATDVLKEGEIVTVDAFSGRIYRGEVPELLRLRQDKGRFMKDTPVYEILRRLGELVTPLYLTDPRSPDFRPEKCRTVHDLMRLIHELSYGEMFAISDLAADHGTFAVKLTAPLPLDLYLIDLGGGLAEAPGWTRRVRPEQVTSAPFKALLAGMLLPELRHAEPRPVDMKGFFSVMSQQMLTNPEGAERFGDKSYALISDKYLNFSSRVGYHYSVLDAYCGLTMNKNYISFQFKGGAADDVRKNRRVRSIARILEEHDFNVEVAGDRVVARFQKYDAEATAARLDMLGRLLIFTRQMDMLMIDEGSVRRVSQCFLDGDYHYEGNGASGARDGENG